MRPLRAVEFFQGTLDSTEEIQTARVFDTTLRDGEQSPGTSFSYDDKREIAAILDEMGTHVIEAGFPVNSDAEFEAVRDIAESTSTTTCGLARVVEGDIEAALDSGVELVHVFVSTSDVQIEDSMHSTREDVVQRAVESVERVKDAGVECMFSPMDATRTDEPFLIEVIEAVSDAGTDWINIPDTCGVATPRRFYDLIEKVCAHTDARIDVHTHDDFGLATANALSGIEAGADQAQVSVNSIGERAGNAAYEEYVMAVESLYQGDTGIDTTRITELSEIVAEKSGVATPSNKPVVGSNAFSHESGIHAAGVIENADTFEPGVMTPEMVGAERRLVLGKHTGTHSVRERLRDRGFDPTDEEVRAVTRRVKDFGAEKRQVTVNDLERFAEDEDISRQSETEEVRA
ncbi:2-isopropylmalate synthase [Halobacteria archaeon AArc-m2/3/4]|uniref:Probable 2-isopropylmalate synthase n=1 Tax=Natronoglomus mannanivorans TaxID=2979990 RepID=A0AAP3E397_9EURY|nr:2-isopropylmalate synthase [Halobacteria archaeon AArc-xg1-1]MCU4972991.1 2-isopropylmalate synthase [Halobacteria archaeon AArc-m2/3/4]